MDLLHLVRANVVESLKRQPRFMCTETVERGEYESRRRYTATGCDQGPRRTPLRPVSSDRLRLDVAQASSGEIYSWTGESRFNDRDLLDMVHDGAISSGTFSAFLSAVFQAERATFTYNGAITEGGRTLSAFGFRVARENSHYRFGPREHSVVTGYHGTFLADTATAALVSLVVSTDPLPLETGSCFATTTLNYSSARMQGIDFLLPTESALNVAHADGGESRNRTVFSNCHEFRGESSISFEPAPEAAHGDVNRAKAPPAVVIPEGLRFGVALAESIDTATAAVGDPVKARLVSRIHNGSVVLIPAGAPVAARIVRLKQFYSGENTLSFGIRLESVSVNGSAVPLVATPDWEAAFPQPVDRTLRRRVQLGVPQGMEDRAVSFEIRDVHLPYRIDSGLPSYWITGSDERRRPQEKEFLLPR